MGNALPACHLPIMVLGILCHILRFTHGIKVHGGFAVFRRSGPKIAQKLEGGRFYIERDGLKFWAFEKQNKTKPKKKNQKKTKQQQ